MQDTAHFNSNILFGFNDPLNKHYIFFFDIMP
jgi:hypothetical protein